MNNPSYKDDNNYNKNLNAFKTYLEFKNEIKRAIDPYIYPNCLYNDGEISIGECKSYKDAKWFPIQNLAYPDNNNDFCICKKDDGYNMYRKYKEDGRRIFFIYDKSRSVNDAYKRVLMMCKDGNLYFWNNYDKPAGSTKDKESSIWNYINSLPREAQIVLSSIAEGEITESKTNKNMKKNTIKLNEEQLRNLIAESVKKVLTEGQVKSGNIWNELGDMRLMAKYLQTKVADMDDAERDILYEKVYPLYCELWRIARSCGY